MWKKWAQLEGDQLKERKLNEEEEEKNNYDLIIPEKILSRRRHRKLIKIGRAHV